MIKIYIILFIVGLLGGIGYYVNDMQARMDQLRANNAKLESAVETQKATIDTLESSAEKQAELNKNLQVQLQLAEAYQDDLRAKLQKHDLTRLSEKKPGLIEKRINGATSKLFDDIELDTSK